MTLTSNFIPENTSKTMIGFLNIAKIIEQYNFFEPSKLFTSETGTTATLASAFHAIEPSRTADLMPVSVQFDLSARRAVPRINLNLDSGSTNIKPNVILDEFYSILRLLITEYLSGEKDIPNLARELGSAWTEDDVVSLLESIGIYRDNSLLQVSEANEEAILGKLAKIRNSHTHGEYNSEDWIQRETKASQRIESIYASDEDFVE